VRLSLPPAGLLGPLERLREASEILDGPAAEPAIREGSLDDLARINRLLGGAALSRSALVRLLTGRYHGPRVPAGRGPSIRMLDVGTGGGELPATLLRWAGRRGLGLEIVAIDQRSETIELARGRQRGLAALTFAVADARALPYRDSSFDVAHSSLLAHHFDPPELLTVLRELRRVSRRAVIVNDLDRARRWVAVARFLGPLATRNPITRHDAVVSARCAYRPAELAQLAARVGLVEAARVRGFLGHRYALLFVPSAGEPGTAPSANVQV
jgi:SAM-dependent methyltransferase